MRRHLLAASVLLLSCAGPQKPVEHAASPVLAARCGDYTAVAKDAVANARGEARKALESWAPPAPVPPAGRAAVEEVARQYLAKCARDEVVSLTQQLIAFPTVGEEAPAATSPAFAEMARFLDRWAQDAGLTFTSHGQHAAWEISLGGAQGPASLGFVMHGDVVPPVGKDTAAKTAPGALPPGWSRPPFEGVVDGDRLYGRGSEDDKGPIAASLVVLRTMAKLGLTPRERLVAIIGTGEESEWEPFIAYTRSTRQPRHVLSLDSNFPVVVSEMGWVAWRLTAQPRSGKAIRCAEVLEAHGGEFITQVPGEAVAKLRPGAQMKRADLVDLLQGIATEEVGRLSTKAGGPDIKRLAFGGFVVSSGPDSFEARAGPEGTLELRATGIAVHSSVPEDGHNALWLLAKVTSRAGICEGGPGTMLRLLADRFAGDHLGQKLGLAYSDPIQGPMISVPTVLRTEGRAAKLDINIRRPGGLSNADFSRRLDETVVALQREYGVELVERKAERYVGDAHVADVQGPLVSLLLDVYSRHTGDKNPKPIGIRGGTYGRLFEGGVSFGPAMPGKPYTGHMPDEYVEISNLTLLTRMLLDVALQVETLPVKPGVPPKR